MRTITSIAEKHRLLSLPDPLHPLFSFVRLAEVRAIDDSIWHRFSLPFYCIALKRNVSIKMQYGQQSYDYDKGMMNFIAPKQVLSLDAPPEYEKGDDAGYSLFFHPEFLSKSPLASKIKKYGFFSYAVNEALHLSEREEKNIADIFLKIEDEYQHMDRHSQDLIITQIELLLTYGNRFYERQFNTRKAASHDILSKMEQLLNEYFDGKDMLATGIPTVEHLASQLNLSPSYLSDLLKSLTGQSAQQHIQDKLIEKGKEYLSLTSLPISQIAYRLGFQHPQSFNRLFKKRTNIAPLAYRRKFE